MSKRLNKCISSFGYFDKSLIVLSAANDSISIASFATVIGKPVGDGSANLSLAWSCFTGTAKSCHKQDEIKRKSVIKLLCCLEVN